MKKSSNAGDWLPLAKKTRVAGGEPSGEAFRREWIDFRQGIRVGNLEPHERITQILKHHLERKYGTVFVTDRWGRGVYWQWICWLPKANRLAKPLSGSVNFGCAKLFISVDRQKRLFQSGLQVERGIAAGTATYTGTLLQDDWDWHRLLAQCHKGTALDAQLRRLILQEGFVAEIGEWQDNLVLDSKSFTSASRLRSAARRIPTERWGGFQLYYPMPAEEIKASSGYEIVQAVKAVFDEVMPVMNLCMQVALEPQGAAG